MIFVFIVHLSSEIYIYTHFHYVHSNSSVFNDLCDMRESKENPARFNISTFFHVYALVRNVSDSFIIMCIFKSVLIFKIFCMSPTLE